jgi:CO/xanthine dehydrogenase FAD-binding subunit
VYHTALEPEEILTRVTFPAWPSGRRWSFHEVSRRTGDFAVAGVAAHADVDADGRCSAAGVVVFGAAERPMVVAEVAQRLVGGRVDEPMVRDAAAAARAAVPTRGDLHASASYRSRLVETLVKRALSDMFIAQSRWKEDDA